MTMSRSKISASRDLRTPQFVRAAASDEGALTETRLREALAREAVLLRQIDVLTHEQEVFKKLLGRPEDAGNHVACLTRRQRQVLELILAGELNKTIAADIGISQRTVEHHRASIMKKTGAKSPLALVRLALAVAWHHNLPSANVPSAAVQSVSRRGADAVRDALTAAGEGTTDDSTPRRQ